MNLLHPLTSHFKVIVWFHDTYHVLQACCLIGCYNFLLHNFDKCHYSGDAIEPGAYGWFYKSVYKLFLLYYNEPITFWIYFVWSSCKSTHDSINCFVDCDCVKWMTLYCQFMCCAHCSHAAYAMLLTSHTCWWFKDKFDTHYFCANELNMFWNHRTVCRNK